MKILVVDDDLRIVKTACDILKIKGHDPITAFSGEEGVEKVRADAPDCVLMDIRMTGINGVDAMKQMRQIVPDLPVVLVSAYAAEGLTEEAMRAGAYAVLSKPLDIPMILSFLSLLGKSESILVVDDDANFCKTLGDILRLEGFKVVTETEPRGVVGHLAGSDNPDIILLDVKLGVVDGVDVLEDIHARHPGKSVIVMTGHQKEMPASIERARKIGAYTILYKPFEIDDLFRLIDEIRRKKLHSSLIPE